jgi:acyl-homoserine lactone synthase
MSVIRLVTPENDYHYRAEMEHYRFRHQVFVKEMGWHNLAKPDGREVAQFDNKHCRAYALHRAWRDAWLPAPAPHSDILAELCEVERPIGADIWEISRHCVAPDHRSGEPYASPIANALGSGLLEWSLKVHHRDRTRLAAQD